MNAIRTLPIRLTPLAGEALDSWLEGIAHRTHTAFGDMLLAVGLNSYRGNGTSSWIVKLSDHEAQRMSAATEVAVDVLETMTLDHFSERALRTKADSPTLSRTFPWGGACGSRFCPLCLKDTSGRWQCRGGRWAFACIRAPLLAC
jgi:hypothetical protein